MLAKQRCAKLEQRPTCFSWLANNNLIELIINFAGKKWMTNGQEATDKTRQRNSTWLSQGSARLALLMAQWLLIGRLQFNRRDQLHKLATCKRDGPNGAASIRAKRKVPITSINSACYHSPVLFAQEQTLIKHKRDYLVSSRAQESFLDEDISAYFLRQAWLETLQSINWLRNAQTLKL